MRRREAIEWLEKKSWHVTDLRVEALEAGVDLTTLQCTAWSDGGPCGTCICNAMEERGTPVEVRPPREELN